MKEATTKFRELISGKLSNNKATSTNKDGSVTQYGVTNAELLYNNTQYIDAATKAALYQWFASRVINTEEQEDFATDFDEMGIPSQYFSNVDFGKFIRFFNTELLNDEYRYKELLRIELTQFDPMVADYLEAWTKDTHSGESATAEMGHDTPSMVMDTVTRTDNTKKEVSGGDTKTLEHGEKATTDITVTPGVTDTNTRSFNNYQHTVEDETLQDTVDTQSYDNYKETTEGNQSSMAKNLPNSIMYSGATAGQLPALDWSTGSGQNQAKSDGTLEKEGSIENRHSHDTRSTATDTGSIVDTTSHTGSNETSGTLYEKSGTDTTRGTNSSTEENTGTVTTQTTKSSVSGHYDKSHDVTDSSTDEHKEIRTGRSGVLPQEAMPKAINYIKNSRAFDWLKGELDSCFLQIL